MATLTQLADANVPSIHRISLPLGPGKMPHRSLYGSPEFVHWLGTVLPSLSTGSINAPITPLEQVYAVFREYLLGLSLIDDRRFKPLAWTPDLHVWEFKTPDIRIFGWFAEMDKFICTFGDLKDEIETHNRYGLYQARTEFFRANLPLDEPKSITFKEYANVLSNAD